MNVIGTIAWKVEIDNQGDCLDVNATGQQICRDQYTRVSGTKVTHDFIALLHIHVSVNTGHGEVASVHAVREPFDFAPRVAVNDGLSNRQARVEITNCFEFPILTFDCDIELLDSIQRDVFVLNKDLNGIA